MDTHLYGRKVYEIMQYWEDADQDPENPDYMKEYAWLGPTIVGSPLISWWIR